MTAKEIGSQTRENLRDSGYKVLRRSKEFAILEDRETGQVEYWAPNDHYAGYVIEIGGIGHEFVRTITEERNQ